MKNYFSIGEAAKAVDATSETLRYYDRIGLVKPSQKDKWTSYRYYTNQDVIRLNTVRALQQMNLSLQKIKEVLEYDDLEKIISFLTEAEKKADEKISILQHSKTKIQAAKQTYVSKLQEQCNSDKIEVINLPERVIMLSDSLEIPTLDNLWNYLSHFYKKIPESQREQFSFADTAGIYNENEHSKMFAVCTHYFNINGLKVLPAGHYLCAYCEEENRVEKTNELLQIAEKKYYVTPEFTVQKIIVSDILQWKYQVQVYIDD